MLIKCRSDLHMIHKLTMAKNRCYSDRVIEIRVVYSGELKLYIYANKHHCYLLYNKNAYFTEI